MNAKGIFFDLYGTLLIYGDMQAELVEWLGEFHACLKGHGPGISRDAFVEYYEQHLSQRAIPARNDGLTFFERRIQSAGADWGVNLAVADIQETARALLKVWDRFIAVDPNAVALLETLARRRTLTLGLISNFDHPPHIHSLVRQSGLGRFFDTVVVSGDLGIKKPDPRIFQLALQNTGLRPEDAVYVGDTEEDVVGANAVGMMSVLIDRTGPGKQWGQTCTIRSLTEILDLV